MVLLEFFCSLKSDEKHSKTLYCKYIVSILGIDHVIENIWLYEIDIDKYPSSRKFLKRKLARYLHEHNVFVVLFILQKQADSVICTEWCNWRNS